GLRAADLGVQGLFFQDDLETPVTGIEQLLAFHAGSDGLVEVIGQVMEADEAAQDPRSVLGGLEQAGDQDRLIDTELAGALVGGGSWPPRGAPNRPGPARPFPGAACPAVCPR